MAVATATSSWAALSFKFAGSSLTEKRILKTLDHTIGSSSALSFTPRTFNAPSPPTNPAIPRGKSSPFLASSRERSLDATMTSSPHPTAMPSALPSEPMNFFGPVTTQQLVMNISGIERLDDAEAWSLATSKYITSYFDLNDQLGVYDVAVSIEVTNQSSSSGTLLRRRLGGWREADEILPSVEVSYDQTSIYKTKSEVSVDCPNCTELDAGLDSNEILAKYTDIYVTMAPFSTQRSSEAYIKAVKSLSPFYKDVGSVGLVIEGHPPPQIPTDEDNGSGDVQNPGSGDNENKENASGDGYIQGGAVLIVVAVVVLPLALFLLLHKRKPANGEEPLEPEDCDHFSSSREGWMHDHFSSSREGWMHGDLEGRLARQRRRSTKEGCMHGEKLHAFVGPVKSIVLSDQSLTNRVQLDSDPPPMDSSLHASRKSYCRGGKLGSDPLPTDSSSYTSRKSYCRRIDADSIADVPKVTSISLKIAKIDIIAPAGKLGIVTETPAAGGPAYICEIKDKCPIIDQFRLEDEVVAVDDEDVREMSNIDLGRLIGSKSARGAWKLTVLREVRGEDRVAAVGNPKSETTDVGGPRSEEVPGVPVAEIPPTNESATADVHSVEIPKIASNNNTEIHLVLPTGEIRFIGEDGVHGDDAASDRDEAGGQTREASGEDSAIAGYPRSDTNGAEDLRSRVPSVADIETPPSNKSGPVGGCAVGAPENPSPNNTKGHVIPPAGRFGVIA